MVGTIWCPSRSQISRSLEDSRHLPWLDKLRANLPDLLSESAEIRLHCTLARTSLFLSSLLSAPRRSAQIFAQSMAVLPRRNGKRSEKFPRSYIREQRDARRKEAKRRDEKEGRRRTEIKSVTKHGKTKERGEKYKRKARRNETFDEDSWN